jgi:hypothetical protein
LRVERQPSIPLGATTECDRSSQPSLSLSCRATNPRGAGCATRQYATRPIERDPKATRSLPCSASAIKLTRLAEAFRGENDLAHMSHDEGEPTPYASAPAQSPDRSPSTSRTDDEARSEPLSNVVSPQRSRVMPEQRPEDHHPGRRTATRHAVPPHTPDTGLAVRLPPKRRPNMRAFSPLHKGAAS